MRKRDRIIIVTALILAVVLSVHILAGEALATGSWGLRFRTEGAAPIGSASTA